MTFGQLMAHIGGAEPRTPAPMPRTCKRPTIPEAIAARREDKKRMWTATSRQVPGPVFNFCNDASPA